MDVQACLGLSYLHAAEAGLLALRPNLHNSVESRKFKVIGTRGFISKN